MSISDWLGRAWPRRAGGATAPVPVAPEPSEPESAEPPRESPDETVLPSKVLGTLIAYLRSRPAPVVLDLGEAVGSNIAFFTEQIGCRVIVADLAGQIERHPPDETSLARAIDHWFTEPAESVDGVLCWDLFDFLGPEPASVVARKVTRMLAPNGMVIGTFRASAPPLHHYTRHIIVDDTHVRHRPHGSPRREAGVLSNREIIRMFEGLRVAESYLLKSNVREILFRKPEYLARRPA